MVSSPADVLVVAQLAVVRVLSVDGPLFMDRWPHAKHHLYTHPRTRTNTPEDKDCKVVMSAGLPVIMRA